MGLQEKETNENRSTQNSECRSECRLEAIGQVFYGPEESETASNDK